MLSSFFPDERLCFVSCEEKKTGGCKDSPGSDPRAAVVLVAKEPLSLDRDDCNAVSWIVFEFNFSNDLNYADYRFY